MEGSSFNPLSVILKENKLTGSNYIDWKRNLNLALTAEEYKFVLTDVCPPPPDSDSSNEEVRPNSNDEKWMRWQGVLYWPPCLIYCSTSMRTWLLPMTWWWTSKRCLEIRIVPEGTPQHKDGRGNPSLGPCSEDNRSSERTRGSGSRDWRWKSSGHRAHVFTWILQELLP